MCTRRRCSAPTPPGLFDWVASGDLKVKIGGIYPLAEAAQRMPDMESRVTTGKLLLVFH